MREIRTSGSVRGEDGNILTYSAGDLIDVTIAVQMMEPGIGVGLKAALEVLQMSPWMLALAIFRVRKPNGWSSVFPGRPVVTHISPEAGRPGLSPSRPKHPRVRVSGG